MAHRPGPSSRGPMRSRSDDTRAPRPPHSSRPPRGAASDRTSRVQRGPRWTQAQAPGATSPRAVPASPSNSTDPAPYRTIGGHVRIVHEDPHVLVVDKPAGLLTALVGAQKGDNLFSLVKEYAKNKAKRRGVRAWIIHRLDKEASGLLVFAKSERAFDSLKAQFRAKAAFRRYDAVVEGQFADDQREGAIETYLIEDEEGIMRVAPAPVRASRAASSRADAPDAAPDEHDSPHEAAKLAITHYRVLAQAGGRALLSVRLETGRKNQIRAHMQHLGHPIAGDRRYGAATDPAGRVCLHAGELAFEHPATGQEVRFSSPTPGMFFALANAKREDIDALRATPSVPQVPAEAPAQTADTHAAPEPTTSPAATPARTADAGWDHVAQWYDQLVDQRGSDHHERVILPGVLRLLAPRPGQRFLDVACGQGILCQRLATQGIRAVGVDASPQLIERARLMDPASKYAVGDARDLPGALAPLGVAPASFDHASCVMALMNIDPLEPVLRGIASALRPGGMLAAVILHPAFRAPGQTSWGWDVPVPTKPNPKDKGKRKGARASRVKEEPPPPRQYRRVDAYLSPAHRPIVMNPGAVSSGADPVTTSTHHRPIQDYVRAFAGAGLLIDAMEEWASARTSQPGPRAQEENRARAEIPMFLALRARKIGS